MLIRSEQMDVFEIAAEENFIRRLCEHLRDQYANAVVRLPDHETVVADLPSETLNLLVRNCVERARKHDLSYESSIAVFTALMFEVAPNFDTHQLCQVLLNDEEVEPNDRLDELINVLTEKNWESIRSNYDINAWQLNADNAENTEKEEKPVNIKQPEKPENAKNIELAETIMNIENTEKKEKTAEVEDLDFLNTVVNINVNEE